MLKEAIADAKAVKETALANAKIALEEAFTPRLQSMLSHKLAEELEDDETLATEEDEMMDTEEGYGEGYEGEEDETMTTEEDEMGGEEDGTMTTEEEDEMMMGTMGGEEAEEDEAEMGGEKEEMSDLDLESIIKELEAEMGGEEDETVTTEEEESRTGNVISNDNK